MTRVLLALLLLGFSQFANSEGVLKMPGGNMIVFKDTPCTHEKVLPLARAEYRHLFKTAAVLWQGKGYAACWAIHVNEPSAVVIIDETGDSGVVPLKEITFDERV